jgi:hypothetical protein
MDSFVAKLADVSKVERGAKMEGRRLGLLLISTAPPRPHAPKKSDDGKEPGKKSETKKTAAPPNAEDDSKPPENQGPPSSDGAPGTQTPNA